MVLEECAEAIETEDRNSPSIAKGLPQPSEGSFAEVEPEGYASSRAGFSTWFVVRNQGSGVRG